MIRKYFRLRRRLVVGLALAALTAVPVAQATPNVSAGNVDPAIQAALNSRAASHGVEVVSEHGQTSAQLSQLQIEGMRWQAMADAYREPTPISSENSYGGSKPSPTLISSENSYGASKPSPTQAPVLAVSSPGGFDWADAGIGASIGLGAVLVLLTSVVVARRTRSRLDQTGLTSA
jgi:hypothetical protein